MIEQLFTANLGLWVEYNDGNGGITCGRIKSFSNTQQMAWVVFDCDSDWDNYDQYKAEGCKYNKLEPLTNEK